MGELSEQNKQTNKQTNIQTNRKRRDLIKVVIRNLRHSPMRAKLFSFPMHQSSSFENLFQEQENGNLQIEKPKTLEVCLLEDERKDDRKRQGRNRKLSLEDGIRVTNKPLFDKAATIS